MDKRTMNQGQEYSNNVIGSIEDILNIKNEDQRQDEIFNYGLSIEKSKEITINYLISWGGPAYRLQIVLDTEEEKIKSITPQYQDWGTYWAKMQTTEEQNKILKEFVSNLHLEKEYYNII
jgi:hypothetical protein